MSNVTRDFKRYPQVSVVLILMVLAGLLIQYFDSRVKQKNFTRPVADFPLVLRGWVGNSQALTVSIVDFLQVSDYALIDYRLNDQLVNLYIAYYASLDEEVFPHSPRKCIPAGGWEIETINDIQLGQRKVRRVKIIKENNTQIVYYWYQQGSDSIAGEYQLKWSTMLRSMKEGRTDTSLVRLTTLISNGESERDADTRLEMFAKDLHHELETRLN